VIECTVRKVGMDQLKKESSKIAESPFFLESLIECLTCHKLGNLLELSNGKERYRAFIKNELQTVAHTQTLEIDETVGALTAPNVIGTTHVDYCYCTQTSVHHLQGTESYQKRSPCHRYDDIYCVVKTQQESVSIKPIRTKGGYSLYRIEKSLSLEITDGMTSCLAIKSGMEGSVICISSQLHQESTCSITFNSGRTSTIKLNKSRQLSAVYMPSGTEIRVTAEGSNGMSILFMLVGAGSHLRKII